LNRPASRKPRVLLLAGGSFVGQNVLECLADRRDSLCLLTTNSLAEEPILFDFDAVYLTPAIRADPDAFEKRFAEVLAHCRPDLVIPCRDDDVRFMAAALDVDPSNKGRFLCGQSSLALAMLDKFESWRLSNSLGLPFAPTLDGQGDSVALARFATEHGFPLIVKPRSGYASQGVRLVLDDAQLRNACAHPDVVIQKYIGDAQTVHAFALDTAHNGLPLFHSLEETNLSLQAAIGPDGSIAAVFAGGNVMRMGRSRTVHAVVDAQIDRLARQWVGLFAGAGWRGPLNIQCKRRRDGEVTIHEFNGRFTGATAARRLLGFDEVGLALRDWLGVDLLDRPLPPAREVIRYPASRAAESSKIDRLRHDGYWEAPA
jgi:carbamoyl-phosphate synthase large subunit